MALRVGAALLVAAASLSGAAGAQDGRDATPANRPRASAPKCPPGAPYDSANPFARILRSELPVSMIAEASLVVAFVPLDWEHPGHALVEPRRAMRDLDALSDAEMVAALHMIRRVATAQRRALGSTGYSIEQNNSRRQDVCHAHFHVIPDTPAELRRRRTRAEMDAIAAKLRAALLPLERLQ
jgi:histidine triad (HIT) family protein